jgi:DNA mismatch endonuclease, patch repair protein
MMSGIRGRDTRPEKMLRSGLWQRGLRFRLHARLPGRPDLVFPRWRTVVFVHGCFWHAHTNCRFFRLPSSRVDFWREKLTKNRERDASSIERLIAAGWRVVVVWECALRSNPEETIEAAAGLISGPAHVSHCEVLEKQSADSSCKEIEVVTKVF